MVSGHDDLGKRCWGDGSVGRTFVHKVHKSGHGHPCLKYQYSYYETGGETEESLEIHRSARISTSLLKLPTYYCIHAANSRNFVSNKMEGKGQHVRVLSDLCMHTMKYTCTYIMHTHTCIHTSHTYFIHTHMCTHTSYTCTHITHTCTHTSHTK